jgi:hypothetical protein
MRAPNGGHVNSKDSGASYCLTVTPPKRGGSLIQKKKSPASKLIECAEIEPQEKVIIFKKFSL